MSVATVETAWTAEERTEALRRRTVWANDNKPWKRWMDGYTVACWRCATPFPARAHIEGETATSSSLCWRVLYCDGCHLWRVLAGGGQ